MQRPVSLLRHDVAQDLITRCYTNVNIIIRGIQGLTATISQSQYSLLQSARNMEALRTAQTGTLRQHIRSSLPQSITESNIQSLPDVLYIVDLDVVLYSLR